MTWLLTAWCQEDSGGLAGWGGVPSEDLTLCLLYAVVNPDKLQRVEA